ncbi:MAG: signal peptide peptidase SppA [bacterium]|nr:signal peptide peptidase SppA [bacterium]
MKKILDYLFLGFFILGFISAIYLISKSENKKTQTKKHKIAVVKITGEIIPGYSDLIETGADKWAKSIRRFANDSTVRAIVLRINSPGGSVGSVQEIVEAIKYAKSKGKKVVASLADVAASGGYYIAVYSDKIVALPGTITGSIGVVLTAPNIEGLMKKIGVSVRIIKAGNMKDIGSIFREMTKEEIKHLEELVNEAYNQFLEAVKNQRKLTESEIADTCDGRIFTGTLAKNKKLVDIIGGFEDAINIAREISNAPDAEVIYDKPSPYEKIFEFLSENKTPILNTHIKLEYILK